MGAGSPQPPRKAFEHPGRFAIVAIGLMIVASLVVFVGLESDTKSSTDPDVLPSEIVSTQPAPGTLNKPQQSVSAVLRDDLTWSDGKPFTAHDVEFTFKLIMSDHPKLVIPAIRESGTNQIKWIKARLSNSSGYDLG